MNKISIDLYDCKNECMKNDMQDSLQVYEIAQSVAKQIGVNLIFKPAIIPYFYGKEPKDNGVSCFCYFKENDGVGIFTLHTFSHRKVAYFDLVSNEKFDYDNIKKVLCQIFNSSIALPAIPFKQNTWGVELTLNGNTSTNANELYDFCQSIIKNINMTQIANTTLEKNESMIVLTTLIAESHIAIFYNPSTTEIYLDIFSCKYYNSEDVLKLCDEYGIKINNYTKSSRGIYHQKLFN